MKKKLVLISLFFLIIILTGCTSKVDINKLITATAIGIDKSEIGFKVTVQAINSSALAQELSDRSSIIVYTEEGETVYEALRRFTSLYPSEVFMSHFLLLVFGEEFAREGISEVLEYLYNDPKTRQKFNVVVVREGTASDLLQILTPVSPNPAAELNASIEASHKYYGIAHLIYIDELLATVKGDTNNPILTGLKIIGDVKTGKELDNIKSTKVSSIIKVDTLSVFQGDKLIGWLTQEESQGLHFFLGDMDQSIIAIKPEKKDIISIELSGIKSKMKLKIVDDKPVITAEVRMQATIAGIDKNLIEIKKSEMKEIEKKSAEVIKERILACINKSREYNTDFLAIGATIYQKNPEYWKKIKDNFKEQYKDIEINVKVKVSLISSHL